MDGLQDVEGSSAAKVFGISELLENVLLFLPLRELLCAKEVSTHFKATINTSLKIRQALFLEPLCSPTQKQSERLKVSKPAQDETTIFFNPLLEPFVTAQDLYEASDDSACLRLHGRHHPSRRNGDSIFDLESSDKRASWRKMLIVQTVPAVESKATHYQLPLKGHWEPLTGGFSAEKLMEFVEERRGVERILRGGSPWLFMGQISYAAEANIIGWTYGKRTPTARVQEICGWDVVDRRF